MGFQTKSMKLKLYLNNKLFVISDFLDVFVNLKNKLNISSLELNTLNHF